MWGKTAVGVVLAVSVAAMSGCGGDAETDAKPEKTAAAPSFSKAAAAFQDQVASESCESIAPNSCWDGMQALMRSARTLRKAMNANKTVGADFWTEAYKLIDTMEAGIAEGADLGGAQDGESIEHATARSNRDEVFGGAQHLSVWLDKHPIK